MADTPSIHAYHTSHHRPRRHAPNIREYPTHTSNSYPNVMADTPSIHAHHIPSHHRPRRPSYAPNIPQYLPAAHTTNPEVGFLAQIVEVLQNSTIVGERGQDALSKFWAAYKKVSGEYDGDMLERCNGNMDIVLIFAGLFSAVNTAFIITMQPNPVDTTNTLLLQLIQISLNGPSAVQPATLSASTRFSPTDFWTQALAYASLVLSLLAAFGAVMGKQWLGYYKTNRYGHGSLDARCKQRHRKFQTLQTWQFQSVLQSFPMLLQMSLLLFGSSLGAWMWTQQRAISILIIATTGFGFLFQAFTIVVSVIFPDCPFQTPISLAIQAIFRHFRASTAFHSPDEESTTSAMQWILETSTNPDVVRSAVELMPTMSKLPDVNIESLCGEFRDMFKACFDPRGHLILQDSALAYGKALIHFSWRNSGVRQMLRDSTQDWNLWRSWRALYHSQALEKCLLSYRRMKTTSDADLQGLHQADTRTALRMAVATGIDEFTYPDDERLVWDGHFQLHYSASTEDMRRFIDQLIGCVEYFYNVDDFDIAGDALLLASGIATTSFHDWNGCTEICSRIIPILNKTHQSSAARLRCVALGAVHRFLDQYHLGSDGSLLQVVMMAICRTEHADDDDEVQFTNAIDLLNFTEWPEGNHLASYSLTEIQHVVLRVLPVPNIDNAAKYTRYWRTLIHLIGAHNHSALRYSALKIAYSDRHGLAQIASESAGFDFSQRKDLFDLSPALLAIANDSSIPISNLGEYICLISNLARSPEWRRRLITDGHVERCIRMIADSDSNEPRVADFHLAGFFLRISPPGQEASCGITNEQWWLLMKMAWDYIGFFIFEQGDDTMEMIQTLVMGTETYMPQDPSEDDLWSLTRDLGEVLGRLGSVEEPEESVVSVVTRLKDMVDGRLPSRASSSSSSSGRLSLYVQPYYRSEVRDSPPMMHYY